MLLVQKIDHFSTLHVFNVCKVVIFTLPYYFVRMTKSLREGTWSETVPYDARKISRQDGTNKGLDSNLCASPQ